MYSIQGTAESIPISTRLTVALLVQARTRLRANTNAVADLDILNFRPDLHGLANDLVTHAHGVVGGSPSRAQSVQIGTADTAVRDLDVDVVFFEGLGLEALPDHLAIHTVGVETHPSFEFVIGGHCECVL
jgi:hypothetical protein